MIRRTLGCCVLVALLSACSATTHGDDYYACTTNPTCPESAPFCIAGRCRTSMTPMNDMGTEDLAMRNAYGECSSAGGCAPDDLCVAPASEDGRGYCTPQCSNDGMCPPDFGPPSCVDGHCRAGCSTEVTCPGGTHCASARWGNGTPERATCIGLTDAYPANDYGSSCSENVQCPPPASCVDHVCVRACNEVELCYPGEHCVDAPDGGRACLPECSMEESGSCTIEGTACTMRGGQSVCVPTEWTGST